MIVPLPIAPALMAPSQNGQAGLGVFLFEMVLIIGIFYFMLIRPQSKKRQQHERALGALKKGDEIVTGGGIVGEVVHIKETVQEDGTSRAAMDDRVTIKSGDTRLIVERGRISRISNAQGTSQS